MGINQPVFHGIRKGPWVFFVAQLMACKGICTAAVGEEFAQTTLQMQKRMSELMGVPWPKIEA